MKPYSVIDKPPQVPNGIIEGILWFSNNTRKIYQLGGWFSFNNVADPAYIQDSNLPTSTIWEFDIDQKAWDILNYTGVNTGDKVQRMGAAANCGSGMQGGGNLSWGFEGYLQRRSDWETRNFTVSSEFQCKCLPLPHILMSHTILSQYQLCNSNNLCDYFSKE